MSYCGLDPAGPFPICPVCGYDDDYTKSYDHRDCIPKIQVIRNMTCVTCNRAPWDCDCPQWAECVHCEVRVEDIESLECPDSPDGVHLWKVPDGDGTRILR